jgi:uncharacterized protein (TIGR00297 family)
MPGEVDMPEVATRLLLGALGAGLVAGFARRRRLLTADGAVLAAVTGALTVGGGWWWGVILIGFFATASALSRWRRSRRREVAARGHERDAVQVLANGGLSTALAAAGLVTPPELEPVRFALFCGALAGVTADTWATELGRLSTTPPRLITSGRPVAPGVSGGVTWLGTAGSALGALLIGVLAALGSGAGLVAGAPWLLLLGTTLAGLAGSLADSLLGATVQTSYVSPATGQVTERRHDPAGAPARLVRGYHWLNNDVVNFAASLTGALTAGVIMLLAN